MKVIKGIHMSVNYNKKDCLGCENLQNFIQPIITCEIGSGTVMVHTIDFSIGFDVMRYVRPLSANLESKCPT